MERRKEPRVRANQPVSITILNRQQESIRGTVIDLSGKGMSVAIPKEVSPGTLIRLDLNDCILLGEVSHCRRQGAEVLTGVQIKHALTNLRELARLRDSLLGETDRQARVSTVVG